MQQRQARQLEALGQTAVKPQDLARAIACLEPSEKLTYQRLTSDPSIVKPVHFVLQVPVTSGQAFTSR